ncbi:MAG: histidine--tRNA ligase [Candidatus Woesearchaeota archaeon]
MRIEQLKGTREFLPEEQILREYVQDTLRSVFKLYGYKPIETSILEFYEIGASKYAGGAEILKETYRLKDQGNRDLILRYELTFKLAKLIALNPNIRMPFKRYEIGKVFRDGPVKSARLREFTQCDVDVVGIKSVVADAEIISMVFDVFKKLKLDVFVKVNNRKLLFGILKEFDVKDEKFIDFALSLDKIEKIGEEEVINELKTKGFNEGTIKKIFSLFEEASGKKDNKEVLEFLKDRLRNEYAKEGIMELEDFFNYCSSFGIKEDVVLSITLARGLGYYTGIMYEVFLKKSSIKSTIAAGGRWDKMIQNFAQSKQEYPATGIAFGLDVIYEALKEKNTEINIKVPSVLIVSFDNTEESLRTARELRAFGISCDIAFNKKLTKALDYANKEKIPYCIIIGEDEIKKKLLRLKDMSSGSEELLNMGEIKRFFSEKNKK